MKYVAIAALLLIANIAVSATSITVYGHGTDRESAKKDAFRTAIEKACGTKVTSKRESFNQRNNYNKIHTYSTCRVTDYKIIEEQSDPYILKIEVTLHNTREHDILLEESDQLRFTPNLKSNINEYNREKNEGDELIDIVFRDYPYNAYNLETIKEPYIVDDNYRNLYLIIPYRIKWNYNFIVSMEDIFSSVDTRNGDARITVMAKNPKNFILGKKTHYHFNDYTRLDHIKSKFTGENELRLHIKARDHKGKNILNICYSPEYKQGGIFYSVGINKELTIFGNDVNIGNIQIRLNMPAEVIYDLTIDVAAERDCKLYTSPL